MTEEEAVRRCQTGDREAFRWLVERYQDLLYGTAFLMTRDEALAEDMVQEAFLAAWRGIRGMDPRRPVRPWLVRILVNRVLSRQRRHSLPSVPLDEATPLAGGVGAEEAAITQALRHSVRRALLSLPSADQHLLLLHYYTGLTLPEVARVLGWREGTVKSRLHRALGRLRAALGEGQGGQEV
jgi:RNA polymerase sigma factor (sigma-70 family)